MVLNQNQRAAIIRTLVANCSCGNNKAFDEESVETLNELGDPQLVSLARAARLGCMARRGWQTGKSKLVVNEENGQLQEVGGVGKPEDEEEIDPSINPGGVIDPERDVETPVVSEEEYETDAEGNPILDEFGNPKKKEPTVSQEEEEEEEYVPEEDDEEKKEEPVTMQRRTNNARRLSYNEFMAIAPPEVRSMVANARRQELAIKQSLIKRILIGNGRFNPKFLMKKCVAELQEIARMVPANTLNEDYTYNYEGAASPITNAADTEDEDDILPLPTINYAEIAKSQRARDKSKQA